MFAVSNIPIRLGLLVECLCRLVSLLMITIHDNINWTERNVSRKHKRIVCLSFGSQMYEKVQAGM